MPIGMPELSDVFANHSLIVLSTKPADLTKITSAELTAGKNITNHVVGEWWPGGETESVTRQRHMGQRRQNQAKGVTTMSLPPLQCSYLPQKVGTASSAGNEAWEVLVEDAERWIVERIGKDGVSDWATDDVYRVHPVVCGFPVEGASAEDAGGVSSFTISLFYQEDALTFTRGKVTAASS